MTIAFDAESRFTGTGTGNLSWTHAGGTVAGVIVGVVYPSGANQVSAVTYGGVTVPLLAVSSKTAAEAGSARLYFLGSGLPSGNQTVAVTVSGSASKTAFCMTVTAAGAVDVVAVNASINSGSQSNPSVTLALGGRTSWCAILLKSGQDALSGISPSSGWSGGFEVDFGNDTGGIYKYDTVGSSDVTAGWTQTADDANAVAIALAEANTGTDSATLTEGPAIALAHAESGAVSELPALALGHTDTGQAGEGQEIALPVLDTGALAESPAMALGDADSGTGLEGPDVALAATEAGALADDGAVSASGGDQSLAGADDGTLDEAGAISVAYPVTPMATPNYGGGPNRRRRVPVPAPVGRTVRAARGYEWAELGERAEVYRWTVVPAEDEDEELAAMFAAMMLLDVA